MFFMCYLRYNVYAEGYNLHSVQSSPQSYLTLCNPMDCSMPGFPVHHQLPELTQTHVHRVSDAIQPSSSVVPCSSHLQSFPASGSFQMSHFFTSGGQSIGVSASTSLASRKMKTKTTVIIYLLEMAKKYNSSF